MTTYIVTGYALVPHQVEISVDAETPSQAMKKAKQMFERGPQRHHFIVGNSADEASVFDFIPSSAMPPISKPQPK